MSSIPRATIASALFLIACGDPQSGPRLQAFGHKAPVYGGTLVIAEDEDVRSLDSAIGYDVISWIVEHMIYDQLIAYDEQNNLIPGLASSYEISPDGKTYTFHLRKGVKFHHGREMVAEDVRYSIERLFSSELASPGSTFFGNIIGINDFAEGKAPHASGILLPDPYTIVFQLEKPDRTFLSCLALPFAAVIPKEEVGRLGERWAFHPVGTGAFRLVSWEQGKKLILEANREYWDPKLPYLDKIVYYVRVPREIQFLRFEAGELHHMYRMSSADYLWVTEQEAWKPYLMVTPKNDIFVTLMNTEMPPFDNKKFRQAVALGFDRKKLIKVANYLAVPANGYLPQGIPGYEKNFSAGEAWQTYNPEKAKKLLQEACAEMKKDCTDGYPEELEYLTLENDEKYAQSIQQDLSKIGIRFRLRKVTFSSYLTEAGIRNRMRFGYSAWVADFPDPYVFLDIRFNSANITEENSSNDSFYKNPEVDSLLKEARFEVDPKKRLTLYQKAHAIIAEDAPYAFQYNSADPELVQPIVKDYKPDPIWTRNYHNVWLDLQEGRPTP